MGWTASTADRTDCSPARKLNQAGLLVSESGWACSCTSRELCRRRRTVRRWLAAWAASPNFFLLSTAVCTP